MAVELFDVMARLTLDRNDFENGINESQKGLASLVTGAVVKGTLISKAISVGAKALVNFGKEAISTGMDFEQAMGQVAATSGKTQGELGSLRDQALELGRTTKFTATEAAEAMNTLAMAGYSAEQTMEVMPTTLNLAAAGALSINEAAELTTGIMAGFSKEGLNMGNAVDQLAMLAASAKGNVSEFGAAINTAGAMASATGQKFETVAVAAGILGNHNMSASEAGNMLNRTMRNLYMPTTKAQKALKQLGVSVFDSEGNARDLQDVLVDLKTAMSGMDDASRNAAMSQIFNAATLKSVGFLIEESDGRWNDLTDTLRGAWYTTEGLNEALLNIDPKAGYMNIVKGVQQLDISMGDVNKALRDSGGDAKKFVDVLAEISGKDKEGIIKALPISLVELQKAFDNTTGAAERMKEAQEDTLKGDVTKFKSAWEGLQITISDTMNGTARSITQLGTDLVSSFNDVLLSGGVVDAVHTLKTMLIDELNALADDIRENLPEKLGGALDTVWKLLRGGGKDDTGLINAGANVLAAISKGLIDSIPTLQANIPLIFRALTEGFISKANALVGTAAGLMRSIGDGMVQGIPSLMENVLPMLEQITSNIRENAGTLVDAGIDLILNLGQGIVNAMPDIIKYVPKIITNLAKVINDNAPKLIIAAGKLILMLAKGLWDNKGVIIENLGSIIEAIWNVFTAVNWLQLGGQVITALFNGVKSMFSSIGSTSITDIITGIKELFTSNGEAFKTIGENIVTGLVNGITGFLEFALTNIGGFITSIIGFFKELFGIASPSTVMQELGNFIVEGLVNGIMTLPDLVIAFFQDLWNRIVEWGNGVITSVSTTASTLVTNMVTTISSLPSQFMEYINQILTDVTTWGADLAQKGLDYITELKDNILDTAAEIPSKMYDIGVNIIQGLWDGLKSIGSNAVDYVGGLFKSMISVGKNVTQERSPSKVFAKIGGYMAEGVKVGWEEKYGGIRDAIESGMTFETNGYGIDGQIRPYNGSRNNDANMSEISALLRALVEKETTVTIEGDASKIFKVVKDQDKKFKGRTGSSTFVYG